MASWVEVKQTAGGNAWVNLDHSVRISPAPPASGQPSDATEIVMSDGEKLYSSQSVSELAMLADRAAKRS